LKIIKILGTAKLKYLAWYGKITSVTDQHVIAEYHLTKSNRLVFDRYRLTLKYWGSFKGDYHEFKCKLLKKQF
jgi:hypothetical protein